MGALRGVGAEVALGEGSPRARFQISLEAHSRVFVNRFDSQNHGPWSMLKCLTGRPGVVPFKAPLDIACDTHVMTRGITIAAKHIDEAFFDPTHALDDARIGPPGNVKNSAE